MQIFTVIMVFFMIWWLVLYMVLPFGNQAPDKIESGNASSAPAKPRLWLKLIITTVIATALTSGYMYLELNGYITFG